MNGMTRILRRALFLGLALSAFAAGCKDDNTLTASGVVSDAEIATIVASTFGTGFSTYGLTGQLADAARLATGGSLEKSAETSGPTGDTVITRQKSGLYSYNYTINLVYGFSGPTFTLLYYMAGIYDTPRMSSDDSTHAEFRFTNLLTAQISAAGEYFRYGTQVIKTTDPKTLRTTTHATFTNVVMNRDAQNITGGTVTVTVTVHRDDGIEETVEGTLTFTGDHQATLALNGKTYALDFDFAEATGG